MLTDYRRILLLTEGRLGPFTSKTAACLLRYRPDDIVGVIDSTHAGSDVRALIPWSPAVPILPSVEAAADLRPDALFIGIAPGGGRLPDNMRVAIADALRGGVDVVSGLHIRLAEDDEFRELAAASGARIIDVRKPPGDLPIGGGLARGTKCRRVLTVGTDCNVGKMVTAFELVAAARQRGLKTELVATGQTGIMINGCGVAVDAVVSDFAAGAVEAAVLRAEDCDLCVVEGQGSLGHPGFSGVTLSLLHGACPDAMILVHHAGRTHSRTAPHAPLADLVTLCRLYELAASILHPARIVGVALNTMEAEPEEAAREAEWIEDELGVPVCDPIRDGCEALLDVAVR